MRYSIMLQLVTIITLALLSTAALFAWLQNRQGSPSSLESDAIDHAHRSTLIS